MRTVPMRVSAISSLWSLLAVLSGCCLCDSSDLWVQFYLNSVELWSQDDQSGKFQSAIVEGLVAYCSDAANALSCYGGVLVANGSARRSLNSSVVSIASGYPVNNGSRYMDLKFSLSYATGGSVVYTVPNAALIEITVNQRQTIQDRTGYYMVYIGGKFYTIPPPVLVNQVVVTTSVLLTALLIAVALGLRHKHRHDEYGFLPSSSARSPTTTDLTSTGGVSTAAHTPTKVNGLATTCSPNGDDEASETALGIGQQNQGFINSGGEYEMTVEVKDIVAPITVVNRRHGSKVADSNEDLASQKKSKNKILRQQQRFGAETPPSRLPPLPRGEEGDDIAVVPAFAPVREDSQASDDVAALRAGGKRMRTTPSVEV